MLKSFYFQLDAIEALPEKQGLLNTAPALNTVADNKRLRLFKERSSIIDGAKYTLFITPGAWSKTLDVKWIDNGNACIIYGYNKKGKVVYKLTFPDFKEKMRLQFEGSNFGNILAYKQGQLIESKKNHEFWMLNTDNFSILAKIPDQDCKGIATASDSNIAFLHAGE